MKFSTLLNKILTEAAIRRTEFNIKISDEDYEVVRTNHLLLKRENSAIPKDAWMSIRKYQKVLELAMNSGKLDTKDSFTITWEVNSKSFAISAELVITKTKKKIRVFGAIMKSKKRAEKLYAKAGDNRYHLGVLSFS